jgi:hypothetical protein
VATQPLAFGRKGTDGHSLSTSISMVSKVFNGGGRLQTGMATPNFLNHHQCCTQCKISTQAGGVKITNFFVLIAIDN